jgi:hypothetical protein
MKMDTKSKMDMKSVDRQFWLRFMLVIGMLCGTMPLIALPLTLHGWNGSVGGLFATAFSALTVLPACALAFWHRRIACIWLTISGFLVTAMAVTRQFPGLDVGAIFNLASAVVMACTLDYTEIARWPGALER